MNEFFLLLEAINPETPLEMDLHGEHFTLELNELMQKIKADFSVSMGDREILPYAAYKRIMRCMHLPSLKGLTRILQLIPKKIVSEPDSLRPWSSCGNRRRRPSSRQRRS